MNWSSNWINAAFVQEMTDGLLSVTVALVLAHILAASYVVAHRGIAYSVGFVRSMILACIATTVMMRAVGNNLAWGFGMFGALSMLSFLRFRVSLRDPRDIVYLFAALIMGVCAGAQSFGLGVVGAISFGLAAIYLNYIPLGQPTRYDAQLRFTLNRQEPKADAAVQHYLGSYCRTASLVMMQPISQGESSEYVYQVRFRSSKPREELIGRLSRIPGLTGLSLLLEDAHVDM